MGGEVMESSYDAELAFLGADGSLRGPSLRGCRVNFGSLLRVAGGYPAEVEEAGQKNFLYLLTISSVFKRNFRTAELTRKLTLVPASRPGASGDSKVLLCSPARDGRAPGSHAAGTSGEIAMSSGCIPARSAVPAHGLRRLRVAFEKDQAGDR